MRLLEPWRTRLLWLSVAGNLFALALIGANVATRRPHGPPGLEGAVERLARRLPPADAAGFRAAMLGERAWFDAARRRMDDARASLASSLRAVPFDEAPARRATQEMHAGLQESAARFDDRLLAAAASLSPEGRMRLADSVQRMGPR